MMPTNLATVVLGTLLAFLAGQTIAWVYMLTHDGVSYSRAFVVSLVMMPVIVALVMIVLANNLVTAFGLMAVFAIVRFRNILRDTLDTAYVLAVIVLGMACGMQKFTTAVLGCLVVSAILGYVWFTGFGRRHRYDVVLHLRWLRAGPEMVELRQLLDRHSREIVSEARRGAADGAGTDCSYRILLRDPDRAEELLKELRGLRGVDRLTSTVAGEDSEM